MENAFYQEQVRNQADAIRASYGEDYTDLNWIALILDGHAEEECLICDAHRLLQRQEEDREEESKPVNAFAETIPMSDAFFNHHFFADARIEAQAGAVGEALEAQGLHAGRMLSASKTHYYESHRENVVFFNACIFVKERKRLKATYRQIWWGDLDVTVSRPALIAAADAAGVDLYVTREKYRWKGYKGEKDNEVVFIKAHKS